MSFFDWNAQKNRLLARERALTFERVVLAIAEGGLLDVLEHPNQERYGGQRLFVVDVDGYAVLVPFVEDGERVFLKTIVPSRKATKKYLAQRRGEADADG